MAQPMVQDRMAPARSHQPHRARSAAYRVLLGALTTLVSVNLWTGGPLLALWIGSKIQAAVGQLSMAAVGATIAVLIIETLILYRALAFLAARYNAAVGRVMPRRQAPWMKPMSGERRAIEVRQPLNGAERIVVVSVVAAVLVFEVWFFFFAHYNPGG
jgi:hypothetical protein